MADLPFLPGNTFNDPTKNRFHLSNTLNFLNGYPTQNKPKYNIGGGDLQLSAMSPDEIEDLILSTSDLTFCDRPDKSVSKFVPAHLAYDKKVLKFSAYFKETVHESAQEHYRVRPVDLYYYLEDDSISVIEPVVDNSGIPQGKLIQRQRLPKDDFGNNWHWTDMNLGINIVIYGRTYRITNCDSYTRRFLTSEGITISDVENMPIDPYTESRRQPDRTTVTKSDFDQLKRFLKLNRKVLRFYAVWDDRDAEFGEMRPYIVHYFLVDDTLEIREVHKPNDGRDPFPVLLRRQKLAKNRYDISDSFPSCVMELSDAEVRGKWFQANDFCIGKTITINNRRFLIYDCDDFTRQYLMHRHSIRQPQEIDIPSGDIPPMPRQIPPYNGFGSIDDSMQNCLALVAQPPKKDFIKMLENDNKTLRYAATMEPIRSEDRNRRFIINYRLADDMISIFEPAIRNSGIIGGKFLERTRITKPGSVTENPQFYSPADFAIGSTISIFKHRFIIKDCDDYVLSYLEENRETFPTNIQEQLEQTIKSIKEKKQ